MHGPTGLLLLFILVALIGEWIDGDSWEFFRQRFVPSNFLRGGMARPIHRRSLSGYENPEDVRIQRLFTSPRLRELQTPRLWPRVSDESAIPNGTLSPPQISGPNAKLVRNLS